MDDREAERQIQQMVNFILNEAKDKAEEIEAKALEDFNIEKLKLVQQMKDKIRGEYSRKAKQVETQRAIARSTAINNSRLQKIAARQEVIGQLETEVKNKLTRVTQNEGQYKQLLTDLIVQGLLMMIESDVTVRCLEKDARVCQSCLDGAAAKYAQVVQQQTGTRKAVSLKIDKEFLKAKECTGGVFLIGMGGALKVDNTLDARLQLQMDNDKPAIRQILFPMK
jgi:V-type H+-transporting ATPase subunit E